jgi:hypothetical protein
MSYYRNPELNRTVTVIDGCATKTYYGDPWTRGRGSRRIWKPGLVIAETSDPYHATPSQIQVTRIRRAHLETAYPTTVSDRELSRIHNSLGRIGISTYADLLCVGSANLLAQANAMGDSHLSESTVCRLGIAAAEQTGYRLPETPALPKDQLNYCADITAVSLAAVLPTGEFKTIRDMGYCPKGDGRDHVTIADAVALEGDSLASHLTDVRLFNPRPGADEAFASFVQFTLGQDVIAPFEAAQASAFPLS